MDISIFDGEFVVFVGPSGCGKSMLPRDRDRPHDVALGDPGRETLAGELQLVEERAMPVC